MVSPGKRDGGGAGCQCPCRGSSLWTQWQLTAIGYLGPDRASIVTEMEWELRQLVPLALCSVQVFRQFLSLPLALTPPPPPPTCFNCMVTHLLTNVIRYIQYDSVSVGSKNSITLNVSRTAQATQIHYELYADCHTQTSKGGGGRGMNKWERCN